MTVWSVVVVRERKSAPGYDILGNIAVVDFEGIAKARQAAIARGILGEHKNVATVLAKAGPVSGTFRTRKLRYAAGKRNYVADYKENGCRFVFDVRQSFFSNRLSYERARIASLSKRKEKVLVMFAGVGPFAIEIAKRNPKADVVAIELNRDAFAAMCGNIMINKVNNVTAVLGDVRSTALRYRSFADRVVMPLPKDSIEFLGAAVECCKRNGVVHIYIITGRDHPLKDASSILAAHATANRYRGKISDWRIVRNYSPAEVEIGVDWRVRK